MLSGSFIVLGSVVFFGMDISIAFLMFEVSMLMFSSMSIFVRIFGLIIKVSFM